MQFWTRLFNLHVGEDDRGRTLENVKANISFSGANLWVLACAIIVASVGLNVNSTAVIIGAMLISPLMGPIVASGFALAIYDFALLRRALKNLFIATLASLLVSFIYFYISPFKDVQSELLARTSPNIYDILIAFFGGLVGVISITRVEKGNPIPGVAIATALMPPLCTAGYGLATGHFNFFFGAFFLYCINCVFICIATFVIIKYLKYPVREQVNARRQKQIRYGITFIILLMMVPSVYFAYSLYRQQAFNQAANTFVQQELVEQGSIVVYKETRFRQNPRIIRLGFLSRHFSREELDTLNAKLPRYGLTNTRVEVMQDAADNVQALKSSLLNEMKSKTVLHDQEQARIRQLEAQLRAGNYDNRKIGMEVKALFEGIHALSLSDHRFYTGKDSMISIPVLIYTSGRPLPEKEEQKLAAWLKQRLSLDTLWVSRR